MNHNLDLYQSNLPSNSCNKQHKHSNYNPISHRPNNFLPPIPSSSSSKLTSLSGNITSPHRDTLNKFHPENASKSSRSTPTMSTVSSPTSDENLPSVNTASIPLKTPCSSSSSDSTCLSSSSSGCIEPTAKISSDLGIEFFSEKLSLNNADLNQNNTEDITESVNSPPPINPRPEKTKSIYTKPIVNRDILNNNNSNNSKNLSMTIGRVDRFAKKFLKSYLLIDFRPIRSFSQNIIVEQFFRYSPISNDCSTSRSSSSCCFDATFKAKSAKADVYK